MMKNRFIDDKNTHFKALCCIFLAGVMILFSLFSVSAAVTVTLNSPADGLNNTFNQINFNCSAITDTGNLVNASLWTNSTGTWARNQTFNGSVKNATEMTTDSATYVLIKQFTGINDYVINYTNELACNGDGITGNAKLEFTYTNGTSINTTVQTQADSTFVPHNWDNPAPAEKVSSIQLYLNKGTAVVFATRLDNVTMFYNNTIKYIPFNLTSYTLWNCEACDTTCASAGSNSSVNYNLYENSRTVPVSSSQGSTQTFSINLTASDAVTSAYLNYNGTRYSTSITAGTYTIVSTSIVIPSVEADGSATIFWELFTPYGGVNSTSSNMAISTSTVDNCTNNHIYIYNFTVNDEDTKIALSSIIGKANVQIYSSDRATLITNYSTSQTENYLALCVNSTFGESEQFSIDAEVEYGSTDYQTEHYNIQNETLQNSYLYQNISLYDLNSTLAKVFKIIYKDSGYKSVSNAIIKIYRKYPGDIGLWKITEIPITDYNGETTANLVENSIIYSFYVYEYGTLLSSFENVFVKCQYSSIDQCTLNLDDFSSGIVIINLENELDFNFTLGYNKTSRVISSTFNIPSGTSHLVSLVVTTNDAIETSVCTDSLTSSSGTVSCVVPNTFGNSTITAKLYKDGVFQSYGNIKLDQDPSDIYGGALVILGLLMVFSLVGASLTGNPVIMIISFLIGIIALVSLNLVANNGFLGAGASILFLVVAIIIVLIKIGRRN